MPELTEERRKTHGDYRHFSEVSQALKKICAQNAEKRSLTQNESLEMICHKLARIVTGDPNFEDHWNDITGYASLAMKGHRIKPRVPDEPWVKPLPTENLKAFHVTYYYLATGMEGQATEQDFGIVKAVSAKHACEIIAEQTSSNEEGFNWMLNGLSAKEVKV